MEIVGRDFHIGDTRYGAATAAGLLLARVDAKVLTKAEVRTFRTDIRKVLGDDTLDALTPLWQRFLRLADRDYEGMAYGSYGASVIDCEGKTPSQVAVLCGKAAVAEVKRLDRRV